MMGSEKEHFIYINLDGFGYYYYDRMEDKKKNLPNLSRMIDDGVFFENASTGIPSITCPMQIAIVSGCYSDQTGNCDKYWDRASNRIVVTKRKNRAQTIAEAMREEKHTIVSIQQFTLKERGTEDKNPQYLYLEPGKGFKERFAILNHLISDLSIDLGDNKCYCYNELPDAIFMYIDDLDRIGHNPPSLGAITESQRINNVCEAIKGIDAQIGEMLEGLKKRNLINSTYILITTDHGMISYKGKSKLSDLVCTLRECGYLVMVCYEGKVSSENFDLLLSMHDIQCQVYFNKRLNPDKFSKAKLDMLYKKIDSLWYVERILSKEQLKRRGVCEEYADLLISPVEGESFSYVTLERNRLYAAHDSLNEKCQHIFAIAAGPRLKKNYIEQDLVYNIDFIPTIMSCLGWSGPRDSTGKVIGKIIEQ